MPAQTPASALIDALKPHQRALLFSALLMFKNDSEISFSENLNYYAQNPKEAATEERETILNFLSWNISETRAITNLLFGDSFPEDLNLLKHFKKEFFEKPKLKTT